MRHTETTDAALRALSDPERQLIGPIRSVVRAHVALRDLRRASRGRPTSGGTGERFARTARLLLVGRDLVPDVVEVVSGHRGACGVDIQGPDPDALSLI